MVPKKFEGANVVYGANQPEYNPLPAEKRGKERTGEVLTCWRLTDEEKALVQMTGEIWLSTLTFGQPLQPVSLSATRPEIYDPE